MSVQEARKELGNIAVLMTDDEIAAMINTLDLLATDALAEAKRRLTVKRDAAELAALIYDIFKEKKSLDLKQEKLD